MVFEHFVQFTKDNFFFTLSICLTLYFLLYIYIKLIRINPRLKLLGNKIPGQKPLPIIGNIFAFVVPHHEILDAFAKYTKEFNGFSRAWIGNLLYILAGNAESAEKLLSSTIHIQKGNDYSFLENWLGTGLLTSKGKKWQQRRKLLTPTFHFKILEDFFDVFNEQSQILIDILKEKYYQQDNIVDICPIIARCTLDIICETAMGEKINAQRNSDSRYFKALSEMTDLFAQRMTKAWLKIEILWKLCLNQRRERKCLKVLHDFTEEVIRRRKLERKANQNKTTRTKMNEDDSSIYFYPKKRRLAFLDLLLDSSQSENGNILSDLDIREETDTFMFAGHDTTAGSITWTIFLLACNPDCQRKVRKEVAEVFSETSTGNLTHKDLAKLHYLECCIKEALRLYPSVPLIARHLNEDFDMGNGVIVPAGAEILLSTFHIQRDPKNFENPNEFIPERFSHENYASTKRNPYAFIPFSAGPRNCIGQKFAMMEEKVILANIFQHFWFEPMQKLEDIKLVPDAILHPIDGLHVKFTLTN